MKDPFMSVSGTSLLRSASLGSLLILVLASAAAGQTATTGSVQGTVRSVAGDPVGDVLVTLVESTSKVRYQTVSSRAGEYRIARLPAGDYAAIAEQIGYAPSYLTGVPIRPGVDLDLPLTLRPGQPSELVLDSAAFQANTAVLGRAAASRWLPGDFLRSLPYAVPELPGAARLVTWLDRDLGAEGLPTSFSAIALDGHLFRAASHPLATGLGGELIPPLAAGAVEVTRHAVDGDWSTPAGAVISALGRRGSEAVSGSLAGQGSAGPLASAGFFDGGSLSPRALRGSALLEGSAFGDSARFAVGGVIRSDEVALSPAWANTAENVAVAEAGAWIGRLDANFQPQLQTMRSAAGFGQLDWRLAAGQRLGLTVALAKPADRPALAPGSGATWPVQGSDLLAGLSLFTDLGVVSNQLRLSWNSSKRESFGTSPTAIGIMVPGGLRLNGSESASFDASTIRVLDALHFSSGNHGFKVGGELGVTTHDQAWRPGAVAEVLFGGVTQLQLSEGVYRQTSGTTPALKWTGQELGAFLQDSWNASPGLWITAVLRVERHSLSDTPVRDDEWFRLTRIANDTAPANKWRLSPRLDVAWTAGEHREFLVNASAGLYQDRVDPLLVGEWLLDDGSASVYRYAGDLGVWTEPRPPVGATSRTRLTLAGSGLRGPETVRATGGFAWLLGGGTTMSLDGGYRHTRFLPRRTDLNLIAAKVRVDQYGRPVFGTLLQQGALVTPLPGTNRRFSDEYDEVTSLNVDGYSTWYGGTVRIARSLAPDLLVNAAYTYSRTRDNWFGARTGGGAAIPVPDLGLSGDWSDGVSDFDVPHRATLFAAWTMPVGLTVSGVYRYQSGRPFTPGFPWGVDVNGDGVTGNDPAFVDPAVSGVNDLLSRWDCLRQASGRLAERNSCRGNATSTVDARVELRLPRMGQVTVSAVGEVIDLLETDFSLPDAALYRIDPAGSLVDNAGEGTVTVPLVVNPDFGQPMTGARAGRSVRLGLALTW